MHHPKLLTPFSEAHSSLLLEQSFHRPLARPGHPAKLRELLTIARIGDEFFGDPNCTWIGNVRKLQRNRLEGFELIRDQVDQVALPNDRVPKSAERAGIQDEFP